MLEATLIRDDGTPFAFQFENDALQTFLAECWASETGCRLASLRALGVPLTVTGDMPKARARSENVHKSDAEKGKTADEARADASKARLNQPIQRAKAQPIDESQPTARTGPGQTDHQPQPSVKPATERK